MEAATQNIAVEETPGQRTADERFMRRALEFAAKGTGLVSPSPLVGCVIVSASGHVVGEGFYLYDHGKHAEALALEQAGATAHGGTAYVSLEPHGYASRTPPCTEALIRAGIARVVYAIDDPNPLVSGRGGEALRAAGIAVTTGVLAYEAAQLNDVYLHFQLNGRPFVHLKMACSLDGKIGSRAGESQWLTGEEARVRAHELRHRYDAILVGANTVAIDDPLLTDRSGLPRRRPLMRVVLDHSLRISLDSQLVRSAEDAAVLIFTAAGSASSAALAARPGIDIVKSPQPRIDPREVLAALAARGIHSLLVEGGPTVAAAFLAADLVDRITFLIAPVLMGGDAPNVIAGKAPSAFSETTKLRDVSVRRLGEDVEISAYIHPPISRP